jgi:hypothetical protein
MTAVMSKYDPLGEYLQKQKSDEVPMTFAEIERITGVKLPRSAYAHRPWWSNNATNSVLTRVWLSAGFRSVRVDMTKRRLVFERVRKTVGLSEDGRPYKPSPAAEMERPTGRHPMIGALKGTFTIEPGYDLTQPAMPEWADLIDEKYGAEKRK